MHMKMLGRFDESTVQCQSYALLSCHFDSNDVDETKSLIKRYKTCMPYSRELSKISFSKISTFSKIIMYLPIHNYDMKSHLL